MGRKGNQERLEESVPERIHMPKYFENVSVSKTVTPCAEPPFPRSPSDFPEWTAAPLLH